MRVSVVGSGQCGPDENGQALYATAEKLGSLPARNGFDLVCGDVRDHGGYLQRGPQ
jgi:predicted Rossmann-fold nucleotide-binding protein